MDSSVGVLVGLLLYAASIEDLRCLLSPLETGSTTMHDLEMLH